MSHEIEQRIRERAYEMWAMSGYPHGCDQDHWCAAEREVMAAHVPAKPKKKSASAKMPAGAMAASRARRGKAASILFS